MKQLMAWHADVILTFVRDEEGATAVEYALMLVLIAAAVVGVVGVLGTATTVPFSDANAGLAGS